MKTQYVGARIPRVDAQDKVTGNAIYGFDVDLPGMLYGATLRSPLPHGRIVEIDVSEALKAPGVRAVVTGKDFPFTFGGAVKDQPFLAIDRVRYVGEPVAAVAAETELAAIEALEKIRVQYEEWPAIFEIRRRKPHSRAVSPAPDPEESPASLPRRVTVYITVVTGSPNCVFSPVSIEGTGVR